MPNTPRISIIIPVYGVEKYIKKCIESVQKQSFKDFEAILVDDGSKDSSILLAKEIIGNDSRFKIIHKENGGLASARNYGLKHAKGEYIAFLDSDDYVEPDFLLKPYQKITAENADICIFNMNYIDINGNILKVSKSDLNAYYKKNDFLISKYTIFNFACDKLFRKSLFNKIQFNENIKTYEDVYVTFRILFNKKLTNIDDSLYNYLQRPGSLSKGLHPTYLQDRMAIKNKQKEFVEQHNLYHKYKEYIIYTYLKTFIFYCSTHLARYSKNYSHDIKQLQSEISPNLFTFKNIIFTIKEEPKVGLSLLLFKISPSIFRYFIKFWFRNSVA